MVSDRYQTEARKVKEEIRLAELVRMREGRAPAVSVQVMARGGEGQGDVARGGGGKQQKKQERKKRLRENQRARGDVGPPQVNPSNGGTVYQHPSRTPPPQQHRDNSNFSHHDGQRRESSIAEVSNDSVLATDHSTERHVQWEDRSQDYREGPTPDDYLPFAFPFAVGSANSKRPRYD